MPNLGKSGTPLDADEAVWELFTGAVVVGALVVVGAERSLDDPPMMLLQKTLISRTPASKAFDLLWPDDMALT